MALGAVRAVQETGAAGKVIVVSVDGIPDGLEAVKQGSLAGTVTQYPEAMAYLAVEALVKKLNGESVPETIDSPVKLITKENLADAASVLQRQQQHLNPESWRTAPACPMSSALALRRHGYRQVSLKAHRQVAAVAEGDELSHRMWP